MTDMAPDEALISAIESGVAPEGGFHHREHVRLAFLYLQRAALPEALRRFIDSLKRFAASQGATGLYHETITVAFVLLINERLGSRDESWSSFADRNPDLLAWKPSILDRYYTSETLWSDRARARFVLPDRV